MSGELLGGHEQARVMAEVIPVPLQISPSLPLIEEVCNLLRDSRSLSRINSGYPLLDDARDTFYLTPLVGI